MSPVVQVRVCFLIGTFYPVVGGGEKHAQMLSAELVRQGALVQVVTRRSLPGLARTEMIDGVKVHRVPPGGIPRWGKYLMLLPAFLKLVQLRREYDVIYVCGLRVMGWAGMLASRLCGKGCVLRSEACGELSGDFIWNQPGRENTSRKLSFPIRLYLEIRNRLYMHCDRFLSISSVISEEFSESGVPEKQQCRITNGIDPEQFKPIGAVQVLQTRTRLDLPQTGTIFAYSGKLNKGKGLEFLLQMWPEFLKKLPQEKRADIHLVFIGSGGNQFLNCEAELRQAVKDHGLEKQVHFTGYVENVMEYLQCSDAFVFPSESEALGISVIEALSCELPVFAARTGGLVDLIEDGQNGRLLECRNEAAWVDALASYISDSSLVESWKTRARSSVLENFSIARIAEKHIDLFSEVGKASK